MNLARTFTPVAVLAATALLGFSRPASADDVALRIGAGHPVTGFAYVQAADNYFVAEVVKRAKSKGHNVRFIKAWAGSVAKVDGIVEAVEKGVLDIGLSNPTFEPAKAALLNVSFYAPFVSPDPKLMQRVAMRLLREEPGIQQSMKPYGIHVLQLSTLENYGVLSTVKIDTLASIKGHKLGVSAANSDLYSAAGATPVIVPAPESYMAIKSGLIDGQVFYGSGLDAFKLQEVTKYFLKTGQGSYVGSAMLMNAAVRSKLPADLVAVIDEVAAETSVKTAELSAEREQAGDAAARRTGVQIVELPLAERVQWMARIKELPLHQARALDAKGLKGTETFAAYFRLLKEEGYQFPAPYAGF